MRSVLAACVTLAVVTVCPAAAADGATVIACDTLLAARRVDASPARTADVDPGCRRIEARGVGTVMQRALIGGAPYECLTITGQADCLWIVP